MPSLQVGGLAVAGFQSPSKTAGPRRPRVWAMQALAFRLARAARMMTPGKEAIEESILIADPTSLECGMTLRK